MQGRIKKMPVEEHGSRKLMIQKHTEKGQDDTGALYKQWGYERVLSGLKETARRAQESWFQAISCTQHGVA